ncbi:hypothetical protein BBJ29_002351 [Phytophthora kernoviae]|uniref:Major facilitator superfamily (MFS) profile domain-containing protein n=1 Tax=Phytophthora kernoviae TaxID=325452 RepID=A0A3F2S475_9STRA|nr:hypothetical protein BBJ29_002351 [Phytophthora kernoviae]RLN69759.1 hypothetical protein BBP00_00000146 [Phytophthora kernoviae]
MVVALPLIEQDFELSTSSAESVVSTLMLGAVIGSLVGGFVSDWIGRKPANLITAALFLGGSLLMTFAGSLRTMLVGRFIAGLAVGSSGPCVSTYVAEIAPPKTRGALVTINEVMVCFGCLLSVVVSAGLQDSALHDGDHLLVSHLSKEVWVGVAKLAGVCLAVAIVDRVGRRPLLLIGTSLMLSCHFIFALCFWTLDMTHSETVQAIGELNLYAFIFAWNLSWAPLMWVTCSELLPDEFRSIGMGITFGTFWLGSALVNQTLLSVFHTIGTGNAFLFYTTLTAGSLGFVYFKVPETMGLTFEQIGLLFSERVAHTHNVV